MTCVHMNTQFFPCKQVTHKHLNFARLIEAERINWWSKSKKWKWRRGELRGIEESWGELRSPEDEDDDDDDGDRRYSSESYESYDDDDDDDDHHHHHHHRRRRLVKHPRSSLLLTVLYKSSYLQLQLQLHHHRHHHQRQRRRQRYCDLVTCSS